MAGAAGRCERFQAVWLFGNHDGKTLALIALGETHLYLHFQQARQSPQAGLHRIHIPVPARPGRLDDHAELSACNLFFQGFNVGATLERKVRDPRDNTRLVASDDCDGN